jgi:hypothetical protein
MIAGFNKYGYIAIGDELILYLRNGFFPALR